MGPYRKSRMKRLKVRSSRVILLAVLLAGLWMPAPDSVRSAFAHSESGPVKGLLNPDVTLNLNTGFSGPLDLTGWDVSASREATAPGGSQEGLASVLQADGSLRAGVAGSFDVSGYRMELTATGAPRFVPAQAGCGTADWDAQFALANGTNDAVRALAVMGNAIYVGGDFIAAGNVAANRVAKFDTMTNTWSALSQGDGNGVSDTVSALAVSGNNLFVGGLFTTANLGGTGATPEITANRVAKFDTMANTWSALSQGDGNGVDNPGVRALAVSGNSLLVGGQFTTANLGGTGATPAISANRVAKFDTMANTWSALSQGDGNGVNSSVFALAVSGNSLFVGGSFTTANLGGTGATPAIAANRIAKFDTTTNTWSAISQGDGNGVNGNNVFALAVSGNSLFVGGDFFTANLGGTGATPAILAIFVAKFDTMANTWSALSQGDGNGVDSTVFALAASGNNVFVGGGFFKVNQLGTGATPAIPANHVAKFDTTTNTWSALSQGDGNGVSTLAVAVVALAVSGNSLLAGGVFTTANLGGTGATPAITANNVAEFDTFTNTWSALSQGNGNGMNSDSFPNSSFHNSSVRALAVMGNAIYVGGDFIFAGNVAANHVAKFDTLTNTWSALSQGDGNGVGGGLGGLVFALAVSGNNLFVGGSFFTANLGGTGATPAITVNQVAKFDTTANTWSALSQGDGGGVNGRVLALAMSGNSLFVGGEFSTANRGGTGATPEIAANRVAKFDTMANTWSALSQGNGNGVNINVDALAVSGNSLFVGGLFARANVGGTGATPEITAFNVAKFDTMTNTWSALSQGDGNGVSSTVEALAVSGNSLFVGGFFTAANLGGTGATPEITAFNVAKFDTMANTWSALSQGDGNGVNSTVFALAMSGDSLFVGGQFTTANRDGTGATPAITANRVAEFDTIANTWSALAGSGGGNGVSGSVGQVFALAVKDCDLFVGGFFLFADNKVSQNIARYR